jgi:YidC/Oxa1 family membrane protein insertase
MPILANVIQDAFSPLISLFESIMVFIHAHLVGGSWGLAIVGLTVLIRAILVPVTYRQLKSMQEMQRLAPQINALKEKYKEDKQRQQQEIMKFYQENKINPLASCLPLVKHICGPALKANGIVTSKAIEKATCGHIVNPVTHALVEPHSAKFLFLPDITAKATGAALVVLIVLYVGSQLASTFIATATADPNQRRLMLLLPVVFVVILYRYPAGLLVYWITTNLWTIGQQYLIRRHMGTPSVPAAKGPGGGRGSSNGRSDEPQPGGGGPKGQPALAGVGVGTTLGAAPPRPPRKKKKRSGRRR